MSIPDSQGECLYCNQLFPKKTLHRHLQSHLKEEAKTGKPGHSFLLKVETNSKWGKTPYFLSLWADGDTYFDDLDDFLRDIWLECCGHMSSFTNLRKKPRKPNLTEMMEANRLLMTGDFDAYQRMMDTDSGEVPKDLQLKEVLVPKLILQYDYDFGSTTSLHLSVQAEFPVMAEDDIILLSRNEPPEMLCEICKKEPAVKVCGVCIRYDGGGFCKKCEKKHAKACGDYSDYAAMPMVNSPRMGVCGYEGGRIDKERDGAFKRKRR